jgi:hypothetical protein
MPERLLEIVAIGLRDPAAPAPTFGADDATVRAALPQLAARAGQPPELASGVVALLWEPGRDELGRCTRIDRTPSASRKSSANTRRPGRATRRCSRPP